MLIRAKHPLKLSHYAASEITSGLPLGACAFRDPRLEMLTRRIRWLRILSNAQGLVGTVHRTLATLVMLLGRSRQLPWWLVSML